MLMFPSVGLAGQQRSATHLAGLEVWMRQARAKLSRHAEVAKARDYILTRRDSFSRFLGDSGDCLSNNAIERALGGIALGRNARLFADSDRDGERAAAVYSLITTAKLNKVDSLAWLADILARINEHPASRLDERLPYNWKTAPHKAVA